MNAKATHALAGPNVSTSMADSNVVHHSIVKLDMNLTKCQLNVSVSVTSVIEAGI